MLIHAKGVFPSITNKKPNTIMKFVKIIALAAAAAGFALSASCGSAGSSPEPAPVPEVDYVK